MIIGVRKRGEGEKSLPHRQRAPKLVAVTNRSDGGREPLYLAIMMSTCHWGQ